MDYLEQLFSDEIIKALGWTILHSLWQGTMIALLLALLMVFLHRHSSTVRYFISATALVTVLVLSAVTFAGLYSTLRQPFEYAGSEAATIRYIPNISGGYTMYTAPEQKESFWSTFTAFVDYFNQHLPLIVTIWMMGVAVLALRFLGGLAYVQRLKSYRTKILPEVWEKRMQSIAEKLDIRQKVKLLESSMVKVPMVIGHLKPVILLPIGTVTGLSVKQIEAILAHELAHIARNDYILNIFQSIIDIVFFYHPAVWWISASVRSERENCCDDIAVQISSDSMAFARALTEMQQVDYRVPGFAMAASGEKGKLFQRVKRLVESHQKNPTFKEGFLAACVLMISILSLSFSADADYDEAQKRENPAEIWIDASDNEELVAEENMVVEEELPEIAEAKEEEPALKEMEEVSEEKEEAQKPVVTPKARVSASAFPSTEISTPREDAPARRKPFEGVHREGKVIDLQQLLLEGIGRPLQFTMYDTTRKENSTVISATLEDGRYFFARLNDDKEITELFVEGEKIAPSDFGKYEKEVKQHLRFVDQEQRLMRERRSMLEQEERIKLRQKQSQLRTLQRQLEQQERMAQRNLERMEQQGVFEGMEELEENMRKAMEKQREELEKLQMELEKATEEIENDSLWQGSIGPNLWFNGYRLDAPKAIELRASPDRSYVFVAQDDCEDETRIVINGEAIGETVEKAMAETFSSGFTWSRGNDNKNWGFSWDGGSLFSTIKKELSEDGFDTEKSDFKFEINEKRLKVNGKKQSDELYKKYKKLMEKKMGKEMDGNFKYVFSN